MRWALVSGGGDHGRAVGSDPEDESAVAASIPSLEWSVVELSGEPALEHTGRTNRVLILAIACFSVLVAVWFTAYQGVKADEPPSPSPIASAAVASSGPSASPSGGVASIELLRPAAGTTVGDGNVPVSVRVHGSTDGIHVSVEEADGSTLGQADVDIGLDGIGYGSVPVFPPPRAILARVRAFGVVNGSLMEALGTVDLTSDRDVSLWGVETLERADGGYQIRLDGWAPLKVTAMHVRIADPMNQSLAEVTVRSGFEPSRPGAVSGQQLGVGSFWADVDVGSPSAGPLWLSVSWTDPEDGLGFSIGRLVDLSTAVLG